MPSTQLPKFRVPQPVASSTPLTGAVVPRPIIAGELENCYRLPSRDLAYSPPPSPTRMSSIPRFESPRFRSPKDTPSLLDETLPSSLSSPSLAHTPMAYTTTRDPRQDSVSSVGLGIFGLFQHDGGLFDGMGALPKRDESSADFGFFMDEAGYGACGHSKDAPEHQEDAWRKRMSTRDASSLFAPFSAQTPFAALWSPPLGCSSPAEKAGTKMTPMPTEPEADDVFFTRSPVLGSPFIPEPSKRRSRMEQLMH